MRNSPAIENGYVQIFFPQKKKTKKTRYPKDF